MKRGILILFFLFACPAHSTTVIVDADKTIVDISPLFYGTNIYYLGYMNGIDDRVDIDCDG